MSIEMLVVIFAIISGLLILALMNYETKKERSFRRWIAGFIGIVIAFLAREIYEAFLFEELKSFLAMLSSGKFYDYIKSFLQFFLQFFQ